MPQYQLEVAIFLTVGAACSLAWTLSQPKDGQIKLPVYDDGYEHGSQPDPFDVTKPEDMIDGYPLDEQAFWMTVCICNAVLPPIVTLN